MEKGELFDYYQEVARSAFADMLHDSERNQKYSLAIKEAIRTMKENGKKANVLDIGTGTGLLAMLAAQHGADSVVTIEAFSPVSHIARKIIEKNGFKDRIKIISKHSTEVTVGEGEDMEQKANILVAEVLDTELIGEGAIKTYNHAHEHLMENKCISVPDSASIYIQIVTIVGLDWNTFKPTTYGIKCPENVDKCSGSPAIHDLQLSQLPSEKYSTLVQPFKICSFDFSGKFIPTTESLSRKVIAVDDGEANAIFFWWDLKMNPSGSISLSCGPHWTHPDVNKLAKSEEEARNSIPWRDHWMQGIYYVKSRHIFKKNDSMFITACHDEFSWWFDIQLQENVNLPVERPMCDCLMHILNSRNRIMQINQRLELPPQIEVLDLEKGNSILFVGDHNLLAIAAALVLKGSKIYLVQGNKLSLKSLTNFINANNLETRINFVDKIEKLTEEIDVILAEPYFNSAVLPYDNITEFWREVKSLKKHQQKVFTTSPSKASIYAIPVRYLNLHKIRWPLKSTCEGFDHQLFDQVVELASSIADENVEPFTLWEYPSIALGPATQIFEMTFSDESIEASETTIHIENFDEECNGIALWVEWRVDENTVISCGPSRKVIVGELVSWKMEERQGVHLIPCSSIESGTIVGIEVKIRFNELDEALKMNFKYCYRNS